MSDSRDLVVPRGVGVAFTHNGQEVPFDAERLIDVTPMWRAAGSPAGKKFKEWRRFAGASFIVDLSKRLSRNSESS